MRYGWDFCRVRLWAISPLAALALLAGCGKPAEKRVAPKIPVAIGYSTIKDMPLRIRTFGKVEEYSRVPIKTMISGQISRIFVKPGDYVKKGDPLLEIDRRPYEAALKQAEATLAKDLVQFKDYVRQAEMKEHLLTSKAISENDTKAMRAQAEAQRALMLADQATIQKVKLDLEYCSIKAPMDGRVGDFLVYEGTVVKANDAEVFYLIQLKPIYVVFAPPQSELPLIRHYFALGKLIVRAQVPALGGAEGEGELTFIDNAVSQTSGTVKLKATFPNDDLRFWPGQFVDVTMTLTEEKARVTAPSQAVQSGQDGSYVFVVGADNVATHRPVKTGRTVEGETIILSGLKSGEKLITDGHIRLYPGAIVYEPDKPMGQAAAEQPDTPKTPKP